MQIQSLKGKTSIANDRGLERQVADDSVLQSSVIGRRTVELGNGGLLANTLCQDNAETFTLLTLPP